MAGHTIKEKKILTVAGVILAFGLFGLLQASIVGSWQKAWKGYETTKGKYAKECALIAQKRQLQEEYDREKSLMQMFPVGSDTKTTWLRKVDTLAEAHNILLKTHQALDEREVGEVYELSIDAKNWEGTLEDLVPFMHELENTSDGMFDITSLNFKPDAKTGRLRGSFVINCAYMRENSK